MGERKSEGAFGKAAKFFRVLLVNVRFGAVAFYKEAFCLGGQNMLVKFLALSDQEQAACACVDSVD